jgi:phosphohistidine phosphatase
MARQLWLLRHADAEPHGARPDAERRLTARGEHQARAVGAALARWQVRFEEILVSPKIRAQQTAELAGEHWGKDQRARQRIHAPLADGFDVAQALDALAGVASDGRLLLVGHEPDLSLIAGELSGARIDLKKGGLVVVRLEGGAPHRGGQAVGRRPTSRAPLSSESEGGVLHRGGHPEGRSQAVGRRGASRAALGSQSDGASGELVLLLRPRELALIAGVAVADV